MDERQLVGQVLLKCVKLAPEASLGDLIDSQVQATIKLTKDRIQWNKNRPSKRRSAHYSRHTDSGTPLYEEGIC